MFRVCLTWAMRSPVCASSGADGCDIDGLRGEMSQASDAHAPLPWADPRLCLSRGALIPSSAHILCTWNCSSHEKDGTSKNRQGRRGQVLAAASSFWFLNASWHSPTIDHLPYSPTDKHLLSFCPLPTLSLNLTMSPKVVGALQALSSVSPFRTP